MTYLKISKKAQKYSTLALALFSLTFLLQGCGFNANSIALANKCSPSQPDCRSLSKPGSPCVDPSAHDQCLDHNKRDGDGCSAKCTTERGWDCSRGVCVPICGDGLVVGPEECDLGRKGDNTPSVNWDPAKTGCSDQCYFMKGWLNCGAPTHPNSCDKPVCGDGVVAVGAEECDDMDTASSTDGCSSTCKIRNNFQCTDFAGVPNPLRIPITYRMYAKEWISDYSTITCSEDEFAKAAEQYTSPNNQFYLSYPPVTYKDAQGDLHSCIKTGASTPPEIFQYLFEPEVTATNLALPLATFRDYYVFYLNNSRSSRAAVALDTLDPFYGGCASTKRSPSAELGYYYIGTSKRKYQTSELTYTATVHTSFIYAGEDTLELAASGKTLVFAYINKKLAFIKFDKNKGIKSTNIHLKMDVKDKHGIPYKNSKFDLQRGKIYPLDIFFLSKATRGNNDELPKLKLSLPGVITGPSFCSSCGDGIFDQNLGEECDDGINNGPICHKCKLLSDPSKTCLRDYNGKSICGDRTNSNQLCVR